MKRITLLLAALAAAAALAAPLSDARAEGLAVVELYTSQGCSSCPPADRLLGELAKRDDVLALSFHVDYWDYIGWKDPFALPESTTRQRAWAQRFGERYVYTPAMVVHGLSQVGGARPTWVRRMIETAHGEAMPAPVSIARAGDGAEIRFGDGMVDGPADVYLALYDSSHTTDIRRGENGGRALTYTNVVRGWRKIGTWDGKAGTIAVSAEAMAGGEHCAVIVQAAGHQRIIGAARLAP